MPREKAPSMPERIADDASICPTRGGSLCSIDSTWTGGGVLSPICGVCVSKPPSRPTKVRSALATR